MEGMYFYKPSKKWFYFEKLTNTVAKYYVCSKKSTVFVNTTCLCMYLSHIDTKMSVKIKKRYY